MVLFGLYATDKALKITEEVSGKKFEKRKLLVGDSSSQKVINNILGGN